ncbi:MAG TPA: phage tail tube protein [Pedomonas sp.]|uniref:phage tail tube protein n=1 Tax=Pedomonas sp. TaxID=2976421 RepID=UPI002F3FB26C
MAVHSKGTQLKVKIGETYVAIPGIASISIPAGQRAKIDTTTLDSARKEHIVDIPDSFDLSFEINLTPGTGGQYQEAQQALEDAYESGDALEFQAALPAAFGSTYSFAATVSLFQPKAAVGTQMKADVTISSTGDVTRA